MVIYIHGFGGSGEGKKAQVFREYFGAKGEAFIAPSLSYVPELAIKTLEELIESYGKKVTLIGSSLGGFYAIYLANKYNVNAVLLNPSIYPYITLKDYVGDAPSFYDESSFTWKNTHISMLESYMVKKVREENYMLLVQTGDEILDYKEAVSKFAKATCIVEEGGNHSFENIQEYFVQIEKFLKNDPYPET